MKSHENKATRTLENAKESLIQRFSITEIIHNLEFIKIKKRTL